MGKMISLQTIAVATAATGMSVSDQAKLFRFTLRHSIVVDGGHWPRSACCMRTCLLLVDFVKCQLEVEG